MQDIELQQQFTIEDVLNKLFAVFCTKDKLDETLESIKSAYSILYGKLFVLESADSEELLITFNIDPVNSSNRLLPNCILLHRKKETNTLYTINALNVLIKDLNGGVADSSYKVEWQDFKNTVLLTQGTDLRKLETKIHKIIFA